MSISEQFNTFINRNNDAGPESVFASWGSSLTSSANDLYSRLPIYEREETSPEPSWFQLSRFERIIGFFACLLAAVFFFAMSFVMFPMLALKPRKFGMLWSVGSMLFVVAFAVLNGPVAYLKHMVSKDRILFSFFYVSTLILTIYFGVFVKSTIFTVFFGILEMIAILYYTVSYFPFGASALNMMTSSSGRGLIRLVGI